MGYVYQEEKLKDLEISKVETKMQSCLEHERNMSLPILFPIGNLAIFYSFNSSQSLKNLYKHLHATTKKGNDRMFK